MGIFNSIGARATEATKKIKTETKLKFKISENKNKILDIYEEIGKKVYEKHIREEDINIKEDLKEEYEALDRLSKEIENARSEILQLYQKKQCYNCYAEIESSSKFCPECEKRQTDEKTVKEEALEKLENSEIAPENEKEAKIVEEELKENIEE